MQEIIITVIASALYFVCSDPELLPRFLLDRKKSIGEIKSTDGTKPTDRDKPTGGEKSTDEEKATVGEKPTDEEKATVGERPTDGEAIQMAHQGDVGMAILSCAKVTNQSSASTEPEMSEHLQKFIDFLTLVTNNHNVYAPSMTLGLTQNGEQKQIERKHKPSFATKLALRSIRYVGKHIPFVESVMPTTVMLNALLPKGKNDFVANVAASTTKSLKENDEPVERGSDNRKQLESTHKASSSTKLALSTARMACAVGKSIPLVGSVLATVCILLPEENNAVIEMLGDVTIQIKELKEDIKELRDMVEWQVFKLQYQDNVKHIVTGMKFLLHMLKSKNEKKTIFEDSLKEFCKNQMMIKSVDSLANGLAGGDIFKTVYDHSQGHRKIFERVCIQLLQIYAGGLAVIAAHETLVHGLNGALAMQEMFEGYQEKIQNGFEGYLQMYEDNFKTDALHELDKVLASAKSKKEAVESLSTFLRGKYYWLEICCFVWKRSDSIDYDFNGDYVKSRNGKRNGVIFYHTTPQNTIESLTMPMPRQNDILSWFRQSVRDIYNAYLFPDAERINNALKATLHKSDFRLWGCVTMKVRRKLSVPLIPEAIASNIAFKDLETSFEGDGTYETQVVKINGRKHLCLVSRH